MYINFHFFITLLVSSFFFFLLWLLLNPNPSWSFKSNPSGTPPLGQGLRFFETWAGSNFEIQSIRLPMKAFRSTAGGATTEARKPTSCLSCSCL